MRIAKINDELCVCPQITPDDVKEIAKLGFKTIICNRPNSEEADQPSFEEVEKAAKEEGLDFIYQPINGATLNSEAAKTFGKNIENAQKPVFAYCRTGTRCTTLWGINERENGKDLGQVAQTAYNAGYDIRPALANIQ